MTKAATGHPRCLADQFNPVSARRVKGNDSGDTQYSQAVSCFYIHDAFLIPTTKAVLKGIEEIVGQLLKARRTEKL
jgi:hypothetical protein